VGGKLIVLELRVLGFIELAFWDPAVETAGTEDQERLHELNQLGVK
jgi:hypothetical protein